MYHLRLLEPASDLELFREAYSWRERPKKHAQPDRMPFEEFASDNPLHLTFGVFEEELVATFLLWEYEPGFYDAHFTSRRGVPRGTLTQAGREIARLVLGNGAKGITAWVIERNTALRRYVEDLGFEKIQSKKFCGCDSVSDCSSIPTDAHPARVFLQYGIKGEVP